MKKVTIKPTCGKKRFVVNRSKLIIGKKFCKIIDIFLGVKRDRLVPIPFYSIYLLRVYGSIARFLAVLTAEASFL